MPRGARVARGLPEAALQRTIGLQIGQNDGLSTTYNLPDRRDSTNGYRAPTRVSGVSEANGARVENHQMAVLDHGHGGAIVVGHGLEATQEQPQQGREIERGGDDAIDPQHGG